MKNQWIAILSAITVLGTSTPVTSVHAEGETKAEIKDLRQKQEDVEKETRKLKKEIDPLKKKAIRMEKEISQTSDRIDTLRKKMKKNESKLKYHQKQYQDRVKLVYRKEDAGLESLLAADSIKEFLGRLELLRLLVKEDEADFRKFEQARQKRVQMSKKLHNLKDKQQHEAKDIQKQYKKINTKLEKKEARLDHLGEREQQLKAALKKVVQVSASLYPFKDASTSGIDPWGFYNRQCTSFVAWRLNQDGIDFSNTMKGGKFSNASNWDDNARKIGFLVNDQPAVGAVAQWNPGAQGVGSAGHVAYVTEVNGDQVTVEEYNWEVDYGFSKRTINASEVSNFIHITE